MERDWKDEQRDVLKRLFEAAFERRAASEEQVESDIRWLGTVNKRLQRDDEQRPVDKSGAP
jgi:hypothetical protein